MSPPKVFISYSHDSQQHKQWVLDLATRLRLSGVDASVDLWDLGPGDDIPHFMEQQLASADRVLLVCSEKYVKKANAGTGGVGYEKMIITAELMPHIGSNKAIPILRQNRLGAMPTFIASKLYVDFSRDDQYEEAFDELLRNLLNAPLFIKPPVSTQPFTPVTAANKQRTGDGIRDVMRCIIGAFENTTEPFLSYGFIRQLWPASRAMLDLLLHKVEEMGYVRRLQGGYIEVTTRGKLYALENELLD